MTYDLNRDGLAACPDDFLRTGDMPEPAPINIDGWLSVLAQQSTLTECERNRHDIAILLRDADFLADMPHDALLEVLQFAASRASLDNQALRKYLIEHLEAYDHE